MKIDLSISENKKASFSPLLLFLVFSLFFSCTNKKEKTRLNSEYINKIFSDSINALCPFYFDNMILKNTEAIDSQCLVYNYLVPDEEDWLISNDSLKYYLPKTLYNIAYGKSLKIIRDNKIFLIYRYRNSRDELLCELTLSPDDYLDYKLSNEDMYNLLKDTEKTYKTQMPMDLPNGSTLFGMSFIAPDTLEYKYRIKDIDSREETLTFDKSIAIEDLKTEGLILLDHNIVFRYLYYDKNDIYLETLELIPDDYRYILKRMKGQ